MSLSKILPLVASLLVPAALFAFPTFEQRVEATFASETEAASAQLTACELPVGKRLAFSTRWDDSNARHDQMSQTLSALGIPSTFYLNKIPSPSFLSVISNVLARGCAIGAHTVHHDYLPRQSTMYVFREALESRIALELASQSPVVVFGLPYSTVGTSADPDAALRSGCAFANAGFVGGAERNPRQFATYGLPPERWVSSDMFSIDDRHPNADQFAAHFAAAVKRIEAGNCPSGPHLTLGAHTWQDDAEMAKLADILRPVSRRSDIWFCTENDYVAQRLQFLNAKIERLSVKGKKSVWRIRRPEPQALGAAVPFPCAFSVKPVCITLGGKALSATDEKGSFALPVPPKQSLPVRYLKAKGELTVDAEKGIVRAVFENDTGMPLTDLVATLRLPPDYDLGILVQRLPSLKPGEKRTLTWNIAKNSKSEPGDGSFYCAVQTDAQAPVGRLRFWQTFARDSASAAGDRPRANGVCPRDCAWVAGPFSAAPIDELAAAAKGKWVRAMPEKGMAPYCVSAVQSCRAMDKGVVLYRLEFEADVTKHGEQWKILADVPLYMAKTSFLLNGVAVKPAESFVPKPGRNQLVVAGPADSGNWGRRLMITIVSTDDGVSVKYLLPK